MARAAELKRLAPYYGYRAIDGLARLIPTPVATRLGSTVMRAVSGRAGQRSRVVRAHMRRVLGPHVSENTIERATKDCFAVYGRYWAEAFRIATLSREQLDAGMEWEGLIHVEEALAKGKGVIVAMPHVGGFDWGGAWFATMYDTTVVAETLEPPELFTFFKRLRENFGMEVVGLGEADSSAAIMRRLRSNGLVGLVCDRDIAGTGAKVEFFGHPTTIPAGPATIALRTGAAVLPAAAYFKDKGLHRGVIRPPLEVAREAGLREDVQRITQALANEFEHLISLAPSQWHVLQSNWPDLTS